MMMPDINLLVYAYNAADPNHKAARRWWENALNHPAPVGLSWVTMAGFVRLMTNPRVLQEPASVSQAAACVRSWIEQPSVILLEPGRKFAALFLGFLEHLGTAGNLTTDAYLAALAIEHQAELHSCDRDFARFDGLRWRNPIE